MKGELEKKKVGRIRVDLDKCNGCRACEMACSAFHAIPKYSNINPSRSRIRVVTDLMDDVFVPIRSCDYTKAECDGRRVYTIQGKEYKECSFCGTICPSRDLFKDPDSGLPLKCDLCEDYPAIEEPLCVQVCHLDALTYEVTEEEVEQDVKPDEVELGVKSLLDKHGKDEIASAFARLSKKD